MKSKKQRTWHLVALVGGAKTNLCDLPKPCVYARKATWLLRAPGVRDIDYDRDGTGRPCKRCEEIAAVVTLAAVDLFPSCGRNTH
jgi:hypothetical protein